MRINFFSIKAQFVVSGVLLIAPLFLALYFFSLSHSLFDRQLRQVIEAEQVSNVLNEVGRDTVDLQRNVLIFKENSSPLAADNIGELYHSILKNIESLKYVYALREHTDQINATIKHVESYKENFELVRKMRQERMGLIDRHVNTGGNTLVETFDLSWMSDADKFKFETQYMAAHLESLGYLVSLDLNHIDEYKKHFSGANETLERYKNKGADINERLTTHDKNFTRIVSLTRHYVYLINVVMTGSANEIIYQADTLLNFHQQVARDARLHADSVLQKQEDLRNYLTIAGVILVFMVVAAFYFRISAPLDRLTSVFESLAEGTRRVHIPDINRKDEIGLLARAANVFRSKNDQTEALLVKTEQMVKEQTLLNEYLQEEKLRAERALSVKTDFLANMSHELRTPLNAIIGFTVRLLKKKDQLQNQQVNAMEVIERNGRHLLAMINDILDLSKIESNKLDLHIASVELPQLCADIMGQISLAAEEKSLRIDYEYVDVPVIQSDSVRLSQILLNLLSNAIKYTETGGVSVKIARNSIDSITLTIADTGVGISEADQKKLFSRFEQFDDRTKFQVGKGTGLGLAIVANLCKILGIQVSVESTLGLGSCFTLVIPLVHEG